MSWNQSLTDGPIPIYTYSEPDADGVRQITGEVPGYHINIAPEIYTDALAPFAATPSNPRRVFAGADTVFLRFADEAEARANLAAYWNE